MASGRTAELIRTDWLPLLEQQVEEQALSVEASSRRPELHPCGLSHISAQRHPSACSLRSIADTSEELQARAPVRATDNDRSEAVSLFYFYNCIDLVMETTSRASLDLSADCKSPVSTVGCHNEVPPPVTHAYPNLSTSKSVYLWFLPAVVL